MNPLVILLVEDSETDSSLVKVEVRRFPTVRLAIVTDGQDATDYLLGQGDFKAREEHWLPDIILLDIKMPRMDGFDFLKWRLESAPAELRVIPVIVMSGSVMTKDVHRAYALGANGYMGKPDDIGTLRQRLALLIENWSQHMELARRCEI